VPDSAVLVAAPDKSSQEDSMAMKRKKAAKKGKKSGQSKMQETKSLKPGFKI
jgi:hypothetical protein